MFRKNSDPDPHLKKIGFVLTSRFKIPLNQTFLSMYIYDYNKECSFQINPRKKSKMHFLPSEPNFLDLVPSIFFLDGRILIWVISIRTPAAYNQALDLVFPAERILSQIVRELPLLLAGCVYITVYLPTDRHSEIKYRAPLKYSAFFLSKARDIYYAKYYGKGEGEKMANRGKNENRS